MQPYLREIRNKDFVIASMAGYILWWGLYGSTVMVVEGFTPLDIVDMVVSLWEEGCLFGFCFVGGGVFALFWATFLLPQLLFLRILSYFSFSSRRVGEFFYVLAFGFVLVALLVPLSEASLRNLSWSSVLFGWLLFSLLPFCTLLSLHAWEWYRRRKGQGEHSAR